MQKRVPFKKLKNTFSRALVNAGLSEARAELCGRLFAENQRDGVYSHGLNRFPGLVAKLRAGKLDGRAAPIPLERVQTRFVQRFGKFDVRANLCEGHPRELFHIKTASILCP